MAKFTLRDVVANTKRLADADPQDEAIVRSVDGLHDQVTIVKEQMKDAVPDSWSKSSMEDDVAFMNEQMKRLKAAAFKPANNWRRIVNIINGLERVTASLSRPQNAHLASKVRDIAQKTAGILASVDSSDCSMSLEEIEKMVEKIYGPDQSRNDLGMNFKDLPKTPGEK